MDVNDLPPSQRPGSAFEGLDDDAPVFATDDFRMYAMKVTPCTKRFVHDWVTCPLSHPGEKAKRRDPRKNVYTGIACPAMKKAGMCQRGDRCPYAHNVFEYWLHPTRYRTQLCNDGIRCRRRVCFFAHTLEELRVPPTKPYVAPETLAAIDEAVGIPPSAGPHGHMLGAPMPPEQQAALARILGALQAGGAVEQLPPVDMDAAQMEARVLEHLYGAGELASGATTPGAALAAGSAGSAYSGRGSRSVSIRSSSGAASGGGGLNSRSNSLTGFTYSGSGSGSYGPALGGGGGPADPDVLQELNARLASLQRSGSNDDREAVLGLLQQMLSSNGQPPPPPPLQSYGSGNLVAGSRDLDGELAAMFAAAGGNLPLMQAQTGGFQRMPSPQRQGDPRPLYMASSLYAPSGPGYAASAGATGRASADYERGRSSLQEDMRPTPGGGSYPRRRSLQQVEDWRTRPGVLNSSSPYSAAGTPGMAPPPPQMRQDQYTLMHQQRQAQLEQQIALQQQQLAASGYGVYGEGPNGMPAAATGQPPAHPSPFHASSAWQGGPSVHSEAYIQPSVATLSVPCSLNASSIGSGYEVRFSGEFPRIQDAPQRRAPLGGLQEHPTGGAAPAAARAGSPQRASPDSTTAPNTSSESASRSSPGLEGLIDQFADLATGSIRRMSPGAGGHPAGRPAARPPTGLPSPARASLDFSRAPGEGRRISMGGRGEAAVARSHSIDLGTGRSPIQGLAGPQAGAGEGKQSSPRPASAQSA